MSAGRRVLAQGAWELRTILRNGEQLLISFGLPILALLGLSGLGLLALPPGDAMAGVLAMAVLSSAFTGQAILLAFDRRYGVLRMLSTTPLGPGGLLGGKAVAVAVTVLVQAVVVLLLGSALGWEGATPGSLALLTAFLALGVVDFVALAVLVGGTLRAEAVLALANLLWVLMVAGGALLPPPAGWDWLALLPPGALGNGLRAAAAGVADPAAAAALLGWGAAAALAARRWLKWD